jgi:hypothetical protein
MINFTEGFVFLIKFILQVLQMVVIYIVKVSQKPNSLYFLQIWDFLLLQIAKVSFQCLYFYFPKDPYLDLFATTIYAQFLLFFPILKEFHLQLSFS